MGDKPLRFDRLSSIYGLNKLFSSVIEGFRLKGLECDLYGVSRSFGEHWSGRCFRLKRKGRGENIIYPMFLIDFMEEPPVICISFDSDWCRSVYLRLNGREKSGSGFAVRSAGREVRCELGPEKFKEFGLAPQPRQKAMLQEFFRQVVEDVARFI